MCDRKAHKVVVASFSGERLRELGGRGTRPGQFLEPTGCLVGHGRLYTCEHLGARVQVLTLGGAPLQVLALPGRAPPRLHGLGFGDCERELWVTNTEQSCLHRLTIADATRYGA